jgi:hypothetical protein
MNEIERLKKEYDHAPETNDVKILLSKLDIAIETLERISQDSAASWISDDAQVALKKIRR